MGMGDWGLGIGDWGLGPIPNPQSPIPIPNPQSPYRNIEIYLLCLIKFNLIKNFFYLFLESKLFGIK